MPDDIKIYFDIGTNWAFGSFYYYRAPCLFGLSGTGPIMILQREFNSTLFYKHFDWLKILASETWNGEWFHLTILPTKEILFSNQRNEEREWKLQVIETFKYSFTSCDVVVLYKLEKNFGLKVPYVARYRRLNHTRPNYGWSPVWLDWIWQNNNSCCSSYVLKLVNQNLPNRRPAVDTLILLARVNVLPMLWA